MEKINIEETRTFESNICYAGMQEDYENKTVTLLFRKCLEDQDAKKVAVEEEIRVQISDERVLALKVAPQNERQGRRTQEPRQEPVLYEQVGKYTAFDRSLVAVEIACREYVLPLYV